MSRASEEVFGQWPILKLKIGEFEATLTKAQRVSEVLPGKGLMVEGAKGALVAAKALVDL